MVELPVAPTDDAVGGKPYTPIEIRLREMHTDGVLKLEHRGVRPRIPIVFDFLPTPLNRVVCVVTRGDLAVVQLR